MSEKYLFIIWNKALFCKKRILNDLSKDFNVIKKAYIKWPKKDFNNNLKAFYGVKTQDLNEKVKHIGNNIFMFIVFEDTNPIYDYRDTYNGKEKVNSKIYDKKWLYRKWTGGNFRIHSTQSTNETIHDLTVLFGKDYLDVINNIKDESINEINTIGYYPFNNLNDFDETLNNIENTKTYIANNNLYIFANCRNNISSLLLDANTISINNSYYSIKIYGQLEGDLPHDFIEKLNKDIFNDFIDIENEYDQFLKNRNINNVDSFLTKYQFNKEFKSIDTNRPYKKPSLLYRIKGWLKYLYCRIKYLQ